MRTTSKRTVRRALTGLAMILLVAVSGVASAATPASVYRAGSVDQVATFRVVDRQDGANHPTNLQLALVGKGVGQGWLAPGQLDAWIAGEVLNDTVPGPGVHGTNGIDTIGIIDEFGWAASGTIAWCASLAPDGSARVTFTVNLRG